jgi:hypothetical protein
MNQKEKRSIGYLIPVDDGINDYLDGAGVGEQVNYLQASKVCFMMRTATTFLPLFWPCIVSELVRCATMGTAPCGSASSSGSLWCGAGRHVLRRRHRQVAIQRDVVHLEIQLRQFNTQLTTEEETLENQIGEVEIHSCTWTS